MDPAQATCRPAPRTGPSAIPLFEPTQWPSPDQPLLPWAGLPEVIDVTAFVPAEVHRLARDLTSAMVETLAGRRPLHQLEPWLSPDVLSVIETVRSQRTSRNVRLLSLRIQQPHPRAVEVALHLRQSGRSRAAAVRLTRWHGRWQITQLAIALEPPTVHDAGRLTSTG
jgi:hypothetical protein